MFSLMEVTCWFSQPIKFIFPATGISALLLSQEFSFFSPICHPPETIFLVSIENKLWEKGEGTPETGQKRNEIKINPPRQKASLYAVQNCCMISCQWKYCEVSVVKAHKAVTKYCHI